jgi:hypothetical protein
MKHRLVTLALGAGLAVAAAMPAQQASAFTCTPLGKPICDAYALVCSLIPDGPKVPHLVHDLLCESFA